MVVDGTAVSKTLDELRDNLDAVVQEVQRTSRPLLVTAQGKPAVVLLTAATYERMLHTLNLARLLAEGERDARAGATRPAEDFFGELLGGPGRASKASG